MFGCETDMVRVAGVMSCAVSGSQQTDTTLSHSLHSPAYSAIHVKIRLGIQRRPFDIGIIRIITFGMTDTVLQLIIIFDCDVCSA